MTEAKLVKTINASADAVWEVLSPFDKIKAGGAIESVNYEGEGVGMVRYINMGGGQIIERLDEQDSQARRFAYTIINDDSPLPFTNYSAVVNIADNGDDTCTVEWTGTFEAKGDEAAAINTATGIYAGGIKGAKIALGIQ